METEKFTLLGKTNFELRNMTDEQREKHYRAVHARDDSDNRLKYSHMRFLAARSVGMSAPITDEDEAAVFERYDAATATGKFKNAAAAAEARELYDELIAAGWNDHLG